MTEKDLVEYAKGNLVLVDTKINSVKIILKDKSEIIYKTSIPEKVFRRLFEDEDLIKGATIKGEVKIFSKGDIEFMYLNNERVI